MTIINTLIIAIFSFSVNLFNENPTLEEPKELAWNKTTHDFGDIIQGSKSKFTFKFTNKSATPVNITAASASCGCTVPNYSKESVDPNNQGEVTAIFDSAGKEGYFVKTITVTTNVGVSYLTIKGNILKEEPKVKSPIQLD